MDFKKLVAQLSHDDAPVGLGGCRRDNGFDCCEFNITVFDNKKEPDSVLELDGNTLVIHHCSLSESDSCRLVGFDGLKILDDPQWELRMLLSKINSNRNKIFKDCAKNCLLESIFCATRARDAIKNSDMFAPIWHKCAAYYLADGLCLLNGVVPNPTHTLEKIRKLEKNRINEKFSLVNDSLGLERATPSLLERMFKSTVGFSELVGGKDYTKIIKSKYDHFMNNSLLTDCYFYLGYLNRDNFAKIKNEHRKKPELIHILRIAFDPENDLAKVDQQAATIHKTCNELLVTVSR